MSTNNESLNPIWEQYVASWKAEGATAKRSLFEQCLAPTCVYTDPLAQVQGWDALVEYMLDFHKQIPGGHFVTKYFLAHHDRSIARWNMVDGAGTVLGDGISYGEYDQKGRLVAMSGFFETPNG